jgi:hypothetical protein
MVEQELDDEDRQARFWRRRPDGFTVNEKEHILYVLEFKRVSDTGQEYVTETHQLAETQHPARICHDLLRLGVSDGLLQVLGHSIRVETQEVQGHHLQDPEHNYFPIVTLK